MVKDGNYKLRASPVVGVGGLYATFNGTFKIVTAAAQVPPNFHRQTWTITAVKGKEHTYTIVFFHTDDITLGGSWALDNVNEAVPHGPIITAAEKFEWYITPTGNEAIPNSYYIRAITKAVGATYYVGTDEKHELVIKAIPVIEHPVIQPPYWQFHII